MMNLDDLDSENSEELFTPPVEEDQPDPFDFYEEVKGG